MTALELKNELCASISGEEWAALEAGKGLYINDHNYLTFMERVPMHSKGTGWELVDGRYVCPHCVPDSIICGSCVCEPMVPKKISISDSSADR